MKANKIIQAALISLAVFCAVFPVQAQKWQSATGMFEEEARWLADNVERESNFQIAPVDGAAAASALESGAVSFADRRMPEVGDVEVFNTVNIKKNIREKIRARLVKNGRYCRVYLQEGKKVPTAHVNKIVAEFDKKIYPTTRSWFGSEWTPGIDGDPKIALLLMDIQDHYNPSRGQNGFTSGYFYPGDGYLRKKNPHSNEREILYLDIHPSDTGSTKFLSVIAHEFQHMIHWNNDPKEFSWVNESLSQLAPFLCGYGHPPQIEFFVRNHNNNLAAWSGDTSLANYGHVYLWAYYISIRIASTQERRRTFVRRMVAQKSQGFSGLNAAIKKQGIKNNVRNLFRSFCVANFLNDERIMRGAYGYDKPLSRMVLTPDIRFDRPPFEGKANVKCWSARAIQINPATLAGKSVRVSFSGQKLEAGKYSNAFDVALVSYASDRKNAPEVNWLNMANFKVSQELTVSSKHNRMMLIVVNRGPETMKIEQSFAQNAAPANFSFAIRKVGEGIASTVARSYENVSGTPGNISRPSRSQARAMMSEVARSSSLEESSGLILGSEDGLTRSAAEVEYDLNFQKLMVIETQLVDAIREDFAEGDHEILEEFFAFYSQTGINEKTRLSALRSRIKDFLKFEELQGNAKAAEFITRF